MDVSERGTEQPLNASPAAKVRPPVARKPLQKPSLPKKPALAAKPTHLINTNHTNGEPGSKSVPSNQLPGSESSKAQHSTNTVPPSSRTPPPSSRTPPPAELPSSKVATPPQTPVKPHTIPPKPTCKTANKVLPPLPKTPPRVRGALAVVKPININDDVDCKSSEGLLTDSRSSDGLITPDSLSSETSLNPQDDFDCYSEKENSSDICKYRQKNTKIETQSEHSKDDKPEKIFNPNEKNVSPRSAPKIPMKPKPRASVKVNSNLENKEKEVKTIEKGAIDSDKVTNTNGNSTSFVDNNTVKQIEEPSVEGSGRACDVSKHSIKERLEKLEPDSPQKALGKPDSKDNEPKPSIGDSPSDIQKLDSSDCDNKTNTDLTTSKEKQLQVQNDTAELRACLNTPRDSSANTVSVSDNQTDETSDKDSSTPKPVPRKPLPRPRPIPRKRQSINSSSAPDDGLSGSRVTGSVQDLSEPYEQPSPIIVANLKAKSVESVFLASNETAAFTTREICIDDKNEPVNVNKNAQIKESFNKFPKSEGGSKITSFVKSRVVFSEKGEEKQYRIIDRSIVKRPVTEANDDENKDSGKVNKNCEEAQPSPIKGEGDNLSSKAAKHNTDDSVDTCSDAKCDIKAVGKDTVDGHVGNKQDNKTESSESSKSSYEDLLRDKSILEPSSLLNEIEEILSRSYKMSSLTRSGSSPEKTYAKITAEHQVLRCERSKSVDNTGATPIRPPRPKKEQKRLRCQSQTVYDSCGSDTESLPDLSRSREDIKFNNCSLTLPPAKPHPPKPKRNKLLKVQRSQSDVTAMKSVLDKQTDKSPSPAGTHKRQLSDASPCYNIDIAELNSEENSSSLGRPLSWRKNAPSRKAPPPPNVPAVKVIVSPSSDINTVVPVPKRGPHHKHSSSKARHHKMKQQRAVSDTCGSVYSSILDKDVQDSSDSDHDYHYISDEAENYETVAAKAGEMVKVTKQMTQIKGKFCSPPKLPPRNMNSSHSFETSSLSSMSHDFDSAITETASSNDDISVSSSCLEPDSGFRTGSDIVSPDFKNLKLCPKTSSPYNIKHKHLMDSDSSEQSSGKVSRPVSGASFQFEDGSGDHQLFEESSESECEGEDPEVKANRRREKKLFMIATEIMTSERVFVDVLHLLNIDFRKHISDATETHGRPVIPNETLNRILDYLPQLQNFNEELLKDLEERISKWDQKKAIADIFVKKGPFLKLYSSYIRDFETMGSTLDEAIKKYPTFQTALKEFEMSPRCAQLALKHYMLKPIQRIPQYRLLLQDYIKHMPPESQEMKDIQTALAIVSEVAHHANENMRHGDYVQKMLEIQRSLIGQFEVIKPGRVFLKEGELMKLSRKEMQPRYFFMFNDVLLYTTPVATGYRLNNVLPLAGMKVSMPAQDDFKTEFNIISVQRSFTLHASTTEEREDWVTALEAAIDDNAQKRNTFEAVRAGAQVLLDKDFVLGHKAPLWIPDARVTMCMLCTCEFTVTWRRHHCRACGRVVCGNCSDNKAPLRYLKYKIVRVCDECCKTLKTDVQTKAQEPVSKEAEDGNIMGQISGFFGRFQKIRKSGRNEKKQMVARPERLKEVNANDEGASMSGYLHRLHKGKKWKRDWYLIKDKVLYTFKATQNTAAEDSMVLLGYEVSRFTEMEEPSHYFEGIEPDLLFQLSHANTDPMVFRTDSATATERWVTVMRESTVA